MTLSTLLGSIELGLIFAILSLGLFITFRILDLPDLTVDGSLEECLQALLQVYSIQN